MFVVFLAKRWSREGLGVHVSKTESLSGDDGDD